MMLHENCRVKNNRNDYLPLACTPISRFDSFYGRLSMRRDPYNNNNNNCDCREKTTTVAGDRFSVGRYASVCAFVWLCGGVADTNLINWTTTTMSSALCVCAYTACTIICIMLVCIITQYYLYYNMLYRYKNYCTAWRKQTLLLSSFVYLRVRAAWC